MEEYEVGESKDLSVKNHATAGDIHTIVEEDGETGSYTTNFKQVASNSKELRHSG